MKAAAGSGRWQPCGRKTPIALRAVRCALRSTPPAHKQKLIAKRKLAPAASASASTQILIAPAAVPRYAAARASQANRTTEGDVSMSWRSRIWTVFFFWSLPTRTHRSVLEV